MKPLKTSIIFLTSVFILFLWESHCVAGTVDNAELSPAVLTMMFGVNQGQITFKATNDKSYTLKTFHAEFTYTAGLDVYPYPSSSPSAAIAKVDTRKRLITLEWANVGPGVTMNGYLYITANTPIGTYAITPSKIYYVDNNRHTYYGSCNSSQIIVQQEPVDTVSPDPPKNVWSEQKDGAINIHWDLVSAPDMYGYNVYRRTASTNFSMIGVMIGQATSYTDSTAQNGTSYYYAVTALDTSRNESSFSETGETYNDLKILNYSFPEGSGVNSAAIGDVNGDGKPDIILGGWKPTTPQDPYPAVLYIYFGGNMSGVPDLTIGSHFISFDRLAVVDLNNDGYDDIIVGSPGSGNGDGIEGEGAVYVYAGGPQINATPVFTLAGNSKGCWTIMGCEEEHLGSAIAKAGDVDGDGYQDVVIGAPRAGFDYSDYRGRIVILHGNPSLSALRSESFYSDSPTGFMGRSVASAGDVNGDGYSDIIAGGSGRASLFLGGPNVTKVFEFSSDVQNDYFGYLVSSAGDVNADGYSDIAVADINGTVRIYYGGPSFRNEPDSILYQSNPTVNFIAPIGDINNDSHDDFVTNGPTVYFSNSAGDLVSDITGTDGLQVLAVGDANGDGVKDIVALNATTGVVSVLSIASYRPLPDITLTSFHDYMETKNQSVVIQGSVRGTVSRFMVKGQVIPLQADGTFSVNMSLALGDNIIEILAESPEGRISKRKVTINYNPLVVIITSPLDNSVVNTTSILVRVTANDPSASITVNGNPAVPSPPDGSLAAPVNLVEGPNRITAIARNAYGDASQSITVTLLTKGTVAGKVTNSANMLPLPSVSVTITDSQGQHTAVTDTTGSYIVYNLTQGNFLATFTKAGYTEQNISSSLVAGETKTLDVQMSPSSPLTIVITSPQDGAVYNISPITVTGSVTNNASVTVNGASAVVSNGVFTASAALVGGQNAIISTATDTYGQTASQSISVTLIKLDAWDISVNPATHDFNQVTIGSSATYDIIVSNSGSGSLMIGNIGAPQTPFSISSDQCSGSTLLALATCRISVRFQSLAVGAFSSSITIPSNDADNPLVTVTLSGTGQAFADEYYLPDTGQEMCYTGSGAVVTCPAPGLSQAQDGSYRINPPVFTINGNGTATDSNTGLVWQQQNDDLKRTWADAGAYCSDLTLAGYTDWRMPTMIELFGLVDYGTFQPAIDGAKFPNTRVDGYWTSKTSVNNAWYVDFTEGTLSSTTQSSSFYVRCVRGTSNSFALLQDNYDGTISDLKTGLMWMQSYLVSTMDWSSALSICESAIYAGYSDWRLPNIKELLTNDAACFNWSSTTRTSSPGEAVTTNTCEVVSPVAKSVTDRYVWCLRGGNVNTPPVSPMISNINLSNITADSATVTWVTDQASNSMVEYGTTMSYGRSASDPALTTNHSITLTGLAQGITYHFKITSTNSRGLFSSSADGVVTTLAPPAITGLLVMNVTSNSAIVTWTTDRPSDSLVEYGTTASYGSLATEQTATTGHNITITNLSPGTTYHYRVTSAIGGLSSTSGDGTFSTLNSAFTATTLGDYGNVTVMEVSGNYDAKKADGSINDLPRQEIAREFIRTHQDQYDFLVIVSNFNFAMPQGEAKAYYMEVKNDVQGIGKTVFDNSASYGSSGKLQGTIDMGNIAGLGVSPLDPSTFEQTLDTLAHEQLHRWGTGVRFKNPDGTLSTALYGKDNAHWSYLLDTDGSLEYGNDWKSNGDGTFTSVSASKYYSALDLYLMGMIDKSQVPPMTLIENTNFDSSLLPSIGITITGTARTVTIDDIIAAEGRRVPDATTSQKSFKTGFIFITQPGTFTGTEPAGIEQLRSAWAGRFASLTGVKGSIAGVAPSLAVTITSPANNSTVTRPDVTVTGMIANSTGNETGMTVNGIVAMVTGDQFIAEHVPLTEGSNTITVTATDTAGTTVTSSISVNATATGNYIRVISNVESGIAPLEVTLRVDGSFSITNASINASSQVQPEVTIISPDEYKVKMIAEGTYIFTISATGPDGNTYQDTAIITVQNRSQLDVLLKTKWEGMKTKLAAQDIEGAVGYFNSPSQDRYRQIFQALTSALPDLVQNMQDIQLIYAYKDVVKYRIRRDELYGGQMMTITYYIYFARNEKGLWRIEKY